MRAVVVREVGGPEALEVAELPVPEPGPGQVRVDVAAAGVNFIDVYHRTGKYPQPRPFGVGSEGAGTVSAVGEGVDGVRVGDPVAWAMVHGAGYAEQVVVPAAKLLPVPAGVDLETAAAVLLQGLTVQYLTTSTFEVTVGDVVLVHAAAGGVGLLLTQVCAARGARVIGTTSTAEKAKLAREAGAGDVVLYGEEDVADAVRRLTDGRGVDVVYDGVGAATWHGSLASLRPRGMMVLYGAASGPPPAFQPEELGKLGSLFLTRPSLAQHMATREELTGRAAEVFEWVRQGRLDVRIGGRYPLEAARQAHEDLEGRRSTGKLLVLPRG